MNITKKDISEAISNASSYEEFFSNLGSLGNNVPRKRNKYPFGMKSWTRKLRYDLRKSGMKGEHMTASEKRNNKFYIRLERLGHPDPLMVMNKFFG